MRQNQFRTILIILFSLLLCCGSLTHARRGIPEDWELHEIEITPSGMLQKSSGDPYIVFPEIAQQECALSGIHFEIRFDRMPHKPFLMELFWRPSYEGFGEDRKLFFILHPDWEKDTINFVVPLTEQAGYKQIRLDFPGDIDTPFSVEKYERVPADAFPEEAIVVESYTRLAKSEVRNPAIFIPFVIKTLRHGLIRLAHDPAFLVFWLLLIGALLVAHRAVLRGIGQPENGYHPQDRQ